MASRPCSNLSAALQISGVPMRRAIPRAVPFSGSGPLPQSCSEPGDGTTRLASRHPGAAGQHCNRGDRTDPSPVLKCLSHQRPCRGSPDKSGASSAELAGAIARELPLCPASRTMPMRGLGIPIDGTSGQCRCSLSLEGHYKRTKSIFRTRRNGNGGGVPCPSASVPGPFAGRLEGFGLVDNVHDMESPASRAPSTMNGRPTSITSSGRSATGRQTARPDAISGARWTKLSSVIVPS